MGKKKKSKIPVQPTTKTDLSMFGSTTTGPKGSVWSPTSFQQDFVGNTENAMLKAQNAYNNREVAGEALDSMNRNFQNDFQNQLLAPAMQKGWLRGSSANDVANIANQDYNNRRFDLLNEEQARQQQILANNLANYATIYDMSKGSTGLSNSLNQANSNYLLSKYQAENAKKEGGILGDLIGAVGSVGSAALPLIGKLGGGK